MSAGAPELAPAPARRWPRLALSLAISGALVAWTLADKDLAGAAAALRAADWRWLPPYLALLVAIYLCRVLRWGLLVRTQLPMPFLRLNRVFAVGSMAVIVVPLRLGELARPLLAAGRAGAGDRAAGGAFSKALATVVVERVTDGLTVAALLLAALLWVEPRIPGQEGAVLYARASGVTAALGLGGLLAALGLALAVRRASHRPLAATLGRLSPRLAAAAASRLDAFLAGLASLPGPGGAAAFLAWTAVYWALNALSIVVLGRVFGLDLTLLEGTTVLGLLVVAMMIPAAPGMVGTFQAGVLLALGLFVPAAVAASTGVAYANVMWLLNFGFQVLLGLAFLASTDPDELTFPELWRVLTRGG